MLLNLNVERMKMNNIKNKNKIYKKISTTLLYFLILFFLLINLSSIKKHNDTYLLDDNQKLYNENIYLKNTIINKILILETKYDSIYNVGINVLTDTFFYDDSNIKLLNDYLDIKIKETSQLKHQLNYKWDSILNIPIFLPIPSAYFSKITDYYGWRKHPIYKKWLYHNGIDILAKENTNVISTANGVVIHKIYSNSGYGNRLIIDHQNGYKTVYAHLSKFNVNVGDTIKKGHIIGKIGNTGLSTGIHLHYEILQNDKNVNPIDFISFDYLLLLKNNVH